MKIYIKIKLLVLILILSSFNYSKNEYGTGKTLNASELFKNLVVLRFDTEKVNINARSTQVIDDDRLSLKKGLSLKPNVTSAVEGERTEPDLVFNVKVPEAGRYVMTTYAVTDVEGSKVMEKATSKFESLFILIQVDDQRPQKE